MMTLLTKSSLSVVKYSCTIASSAPQGRAADPRSKGVMPMGTFHVLSLMISFAVLVVIILDFNKKK